MQKMLHVDTREWVVGNIPFLLKTLPTGHYCRRLVLHFELSGTLDDAEELEGFDFGAFAANLRIARFVNISGYDLDLLNTYVLGKFPEFRADIEAGEETFELSGDLVIPFSDYRMVEPDDSALPTTELVPYALEVLCASATPWGGTITITQGTLRLHAEVVKTASVRIPTIRELGYMDPGGQTIRLDAGAYLDMFMSMTDKSDFLAADVTNVDVMFDGEACVQNLSPAQLVSDYNYVTAVDVETPITWPGPVLPLLYHRRTDGHVTKASGGASGQVQILGDETEPHVVYWRAIEKEPEQVIEIARRQGVPQPEVAEYEVQAKGGTLETEPGSKLARKAKLLPGKFIHPAVSARRAVATVENVRQAASTVEGKTALATGGSFKAGFRP